MIRSFRCSDTQKIWEGFFVKKFPKEIQNRALLKLRQLNAAITVADLRLPPSNHLESLKGDRSGQYSIRINVQWRICFEWVNNDAINVEIVDYH